MLQRQFSFSSSPLREALNRLVSEDLVEIDNRRGFRAAAVSLRDMKDLTAFRLNIEPISLRESIEHGDDEWEAQVLAAYHRLDLLEAREDEQAPYSDEWAERHRAFHAALIAACPSSRQISVCLNLFDHVERYRRLSICWRKSKRDRSNEHREIMDAALARDHERAVSKLTEHIERTTLHVARMLKALETEKTATGQEQVEGLGRAMKA
jgi:DNA-binding GntR family transcriptional regulator